MSSRTIDLLPANTAVDLWAIALGWFAPTLREGRVISEFEREFALQLGGGQARAFSAGRVALAAVLDALDICAGDEVVLPGYTCVAVPNPVLFRGARPVYVDIDPSTLNLSVESVAQAISPRTRAIIVQHTFGMPAPMQELVELARLHGIPLIEDCTHAFGATLNNVPVGRWADAAFFSFEQTKVVSAGAGGVAFTRRSDLGERIGEFQSRCVAPTAVRARQMMAYLAYSVLFRDPRWAAQLPHAGYYLDRIGLIAGPETTAAEMRCEMPSGFLRKWSGAQARVGLSQLRSLGQNLARRRMIANVYQARLADHRVGLFKSIHGAVPAFVRFPIRVRDKFGLADELRQLGIQLGLWFTAPVHPAGVPQERAGYVQGSCPNAETAVAEVANLPCHPRMTTDDAERVADAVLRSRHA